MTEIGSIKRFSETQQTELLDFTTQYLSDIWENFFNERKDSQLGDFEIGNQKVVAKIVIDFSSVWNELSINTSKSESESLIRQKISDLETKYSKYQTYEAVYAFLANSNIAKSISTQYNRIVKIRATSYARHLVSFANINDIQCQYIVLLALKDTPADGLGEYLFQIHVDIPCTVKNKIYWATIIDYAVGCNLLCLADDSFKIFETIPHNNHKAWNNLLERIESDDIILRIWASLQIAQWSFSSKLEPKKLIPKLSAILNSLNEMINAPNSAEPIAASFALRRIIKAGGDICGNRIREKDRNAVSNTFIKITSKNPSSALFDSLIRSIGMIFQRQYDFRVIFNWLPEKKGNISKYPKSICKKNILAPRKLEIKLREISKTHLARLNVGQLFLTFSKLNLIQEIDKDDLVKIFIEDYGLSKNDIYEIIIRLVDLNPSIGFPLLKYLTINNNEEFPKEYRYLAFAAILNHDTNRIIQFNSSDLRFITDFNANNLLKERDITSEWVSNESNILREFFLNEYIKRMGHCIHKLKAKDTTGRWAYYFVLVESENEDDFLMAVDGDGTIDLENFGTVVASNYGESPSESVRTYLKEKYGFNL